MTERPWMATEQERYEDRERVRDEQRSNLPPNVLRRAAGLPRAEQIFFGGLTDLVMAEQRLRAMTEQPPGTDPVGEAVWTAAREDMQFRVFDQQLRDTLERLIPGSTAGLAPIGQPDRMGQLPGDEFYQEGSTMDATTMDTPTADRSRENWVQHDERPGELRAMTPDEIRYDELASLLDFVEGDPVEQTSPSRKDIAKAIKFRLGELTPSEVKAEQPVAPDPANEPEFDLSPLIEQLNSITAGIQSAEVKNDKRVAIDKGLELLKLDQEEPPAHRLVEHSWQTNLATSIAVALSGFLTTE